MYFINYPEDNWIENLNSFNDTTSNFESNNCTCGNCERGKNSKSHSHLACNCCNYQNNCNGFNPPVNYILPNYNLQEYYVPSTYKMTSYTNPLYTNPLYTNPIPINKESVTEDYIIQKSSEKTQYMPYNYIVNNYNMPQSNDPYLNKDCINNNPHDENLLCYYNNQMENLKCLIKTSKCPKLKAYYKELLEYYSKKQAQENSNNGCNKCCQCLNECVSTSKDKCCHKKHRITLMNEDTETLSGKEVTNKNLSSMLSNETAKTLTNDELMNYNGKDGKSSYVSVNGMIYNVTNVSAWEGGSHYGLTAGKDLTADFKTCHNSEPLLNKLEMVGSLSSTT